MKIIMYILWSHNEKNISKQILPSMCFYFKNKWKNEKVSICYDLIYFTTRVKRNDRMTGERHEWKILILITARVKTYFHKRISYMANKRLQGEEQFHFKKYLLEMPRSHAKTQCAPRKLNFVMAKPISKIYTPNCSCKCHCTFPHSYASFLIKTSLYETNNILFSKNY